MRWAPPTARTSSWLFSSSTRTLPPPHRKTFSPSYQHQRERRTAACANSPKKASNIDKATIEASSKETTGTVATKIEETYNKSRECASKELEETEEEVLQENNDEQITEKVGNHVCTIENKNWKSDIEECCVKANNSI